MPEIPEGVVPLTLVTASEFFPDSIPKRSSEVLNVFALPPASSRFLFWNPESQTFSSTFVESHCYIVICVVEGHVPVSYITPRDL